MMAPQRRTLLRGAFDAAVAAADPGRIVPRWLPEPPRGRTVLIGAGKAAVPMARAFDAHWSHALSGVVVTRHGQGEPCGRIAVLEAAHPVPDAHGLDAARALFDAVTGLAEDDLVVALVSGGGSALLPSPPPGLCLADEQALNRALLDSGLPISGMNLIRKHVSGIKGGRLARAAAPARVVTLLLSDIPGDTAADVASGPTVPSHGTRDEALALIARARLALPDAVLRHIRSDASSAPSPSDPTFARNAVHVIGSAALSLEAAAEHVLRTAGIHGAILSDRLEGEARDSGATHAAIAAEIVARGRPFAAPILILSGGETTVTVRGTPGRGGRNTEFALAAAIALDGQPDRIAGLAADTDGIDGNSDAAGAFFDTGSAQSLRAIGLDPRDALAGHRSGEAFARIDSLLVTGPTGTNVNDFRAILVDVP